MATLEAHGATMPESAPADATSASSGTRIESRLSFPVLFQSQYMIPQAVKRAQVGLVSPL